MCDANIDDELRMIRLFGIKYADEIKNCKASYQAEIGKGVQLVKYVKLK